MKLNFFTVFILLVFSTKIHAAFVCEGQLSSSLHADRPSTISNTVSINANNNTIYDFYSYQMSSKDLIKCKTTLNLTYGYGKISRFDPFSANSNIDGSKSITADNSGYAFYKLKNTGNEFLDTYAYISFWYNDELTYWLGSSNKIINTNLINFGQNVNITQIRFYFTATPTIQIQNVPINIGALTVTMRDSTQILGGFEATATQGAKIWLNVSPTPIKTCEIDNQTVTLPTIASSALNGAGTEAGATPFTVIAKCNPRGATRVLTGIMIDNNQLDNTSYILKNTNNTSNVGIKVQDTDLNRPIYYNTEFSFGTTDNSNTYVFMTKNFKASYYKASANHANAGAVNAQAIISVSYP